MSADADLIARFYAAFAARDGATMAAEELSFRSGLELVARSQWWYARHRFLRHRLAMIEAVGHDTQRQGHDGPTCLLACFAIGSCSRQVRYARNPSSIRFLFDFNDHPALLATACSCSGQAGETLSKAAVRSC